MDLQELVDNVESLCALDRPGAAAANPNLRGSLLDTGAYRIKRSQLQVGAYFSCPCAAVDNAQVVH